jgi:hypothetical protein
MEIMLMVKALRVSPRSGSASSSTMGLVRALRPSRPSQRMVKAASVARVVSVARAVGVVRAVGVAEVARAAQMQTNRRPSLCQVRKRHVAVQGALGRPVSLHQTSPLPSDAHHPQGRVHYQGASDATNGPSSLCLGDLVGDTPKAAPPQAALARANEPSKRISIIAML